ncbi:hypothetical protein, partial [Amycolatopsis sp. NPDC000740]|uniref:hypothetical protein n=1 Tax=Amycolatopsis sp. NPDC000740 TaxID=3154269 RepID=UPI0033192725
MLRGPKHREPIRNYVVPRCRIVTVLPRSGSSEALLGCFPGVKVALTSGPSSSRALPAAGSPATARNDEGGPFSMIFSAIPGKQGLYDPDTEQDSCGVAMVADVQGRRTHGIVTDGLAALTNLDHRGAAGAEP